MTQSIEGLFDKVINHPQIRIARLSQRAEFEAAVRDVAMTVLEECVAIERRSTLTHEGFHEKLRRRIEELGR